MIILGIETSCDETALALIEADDNSLRILANITHSQAALHAKYGGVFPMMAKREHAKNLIPLFKGILAESNFLRKKIKSKGEKSQIAKPKNKQGVYSQILENLRIDRKRESELWKDFEEFIPTIEKPPTRPVRYRENSPHTSSLRGRQHNSASNGIDAIAVTFGPGLEPALWVGINFAKALGAVWNIPVIPINHMEGHIVSALLRAENSKSQAPNPKQIQNSKSQILNAKRYTLNALNCPAVALLISGGHTELVLVKNLGRYEIIGETKDDAVGEAFDKVARILGLKYPGGPEISRLAERARKSYQQPTTNLPAPSKARQAGNSQLPRPMLHSGDYHFSFSGLKTAVLYTVKKLPKLTVAIKQALAKEFEDAVTEVLISKTTKAIKEYEAKTLIIAGGVIANKHIRASFEELQQSAFPALALLIPEIPHSTDNALMIALAGYLNLKSDRKPQKSEDLKITAEGRVRLT